MSRLTVPEAHVPAWLFVARRFEAHHRGRRFVCSGNIAVAVEGEVPAPVEPSPLRFAMATAETYPICRLGRPFLRPDARAVHGDEMTVPRTGIDSDDYAIPIGSVVFDLRLVAIVNYLFPFCTWAGPPEPGFAAAFVGGEIVALVASFNPSPAEEAQIRALGVIHGA